MKSFKEHLHESGSITRDNKYDKDKIKFILDAKLKEAEKGLKLAEKYLSQAKKSGIPIFIKVGEKEVALAKENVDEIKKAIKQL